jgi:hypothetical protein
MKNKPLRQCPRHGCLKMWAEMGRLFSLPVAPDLPQPGVFSSGLSARFGDVAQGRLFAADLAPLKKA